MQTKIGLLSVNQTKIFTLDTHNASLEDKVVDSVSIEDEKLDLLIFDEADDLSGLQGLLDKEAKFYPTFSVQSLNTSKDSIASLNGVDFFNLYQKCNNRWILNNNIKTIEQLYPTITYLKDLWIKDRNTFFEELWFILKTNLASKELTLIFHDLKEPTKKQEEKGEKPKLCYSKVMGTRLPNLEAGKPEDETIMKEYDTEFVDLFTITEYSKAKNQLVACAKVDLSPILIMGKLTNFNQLQQSILIALFTGLQSN